MQLNRVVEGVTESTQCFSSEETELGACRLNDAQKNQLITFLM